MKQQENVYAYGYARMPRVIRKGYQQLTKLQKLLYIYLRDLCGEDGVCYRSLRALSKETDFSVGYLSTNIPVLHNEDLIHASMRKHHGTGWEIWHISIVDIWEKNAAFIQAEKEKCSQDEQSDLESVHAMNKNVHHMNRIDESVHPVNESVHAMTLNREPNRELDITENTDREVEGANAPTPAHLIRNEYGELIEVPDDLAEKALASQRKVLDLPEPNIPTPADLSSEELHEKVDGAIIGVETVKRITDKHKAVRPANETPYHIAIAAIGNDGDEETKPRLEAVKIGATHATTDHSPRPGLSSGRARGSAADDRDSVVGRLDEMPGQAVKLQAVAAGQAPIVTSLPIDNDPSQQSTVSHTPGTPAPLPLAVGVADATSRHGDAGSVQATSRSLLLSETAQADFPPAAGSAASGATTAQASGDHVTPASNIPKRPKLKSDPREVQGRIDAYRGYALEEKVEIIRERQAVKTWCNLHDLSDFDLVLHYLTTQDKYWKLEENKHRIGGVTLAKETPKALAALERKGKPPGEVTYADNDYSPKAQLWRQEHMARSGK